MGTEPPQPFLATCRNVNVIGNFVFEFNLITFTSWLHVILFSNLICNRLRTDGRGRRRIRPLPEFLEYFEFFLSAKTPFVMTPVSAPDGDCVL